MKQIQNIYFETEEKELFKNVAATMEEYCSTAECNYCPFENICPREFFDYIENYLMEGEADE